MKVCMKYQVFKVSVLLNKDILTWLPCFTIALAKASDAMLAPLIVSVLPYWYFLRDPLSYVATDLPYILQLIIIIIIIIIHRIF